MAGSTVGGIGPGGKGVRQRLAERDAKREGLANYVVADVQGALYGLGGTQGTLLTRGQAGRILALLEEVGLTVLAPYRILAVVPLSLADAGAHDWHAEAAKTLGDD